MRILVTGTSGFVGRRLVSSLRDAGDTVVPLVRDGVGDGEADVFRGPAALADLDTWPDWPAALDGVVHLGALNPERGRAGADDLAALRHANVAGTGALVRRAAREGVRRVVFVSSANVHGGPADGRPIRETDPLAPRSAYARSKAEAEEVFRQALAGTDTEGCVLRPAPVFGPGGRGMVMRLAGLAGGPWPLPLEGLGAPRSLVAVDHLAAVIALALRAEGAAGETFLVADPGPLTPAGIVRALREGQRRPARLLPAPTGLLGATARMMGKGAAWRDLTSPFVLDTGHLERQLGWRAPADAAAGLRAMGRASREGRDR